MPTAPLFSSAPPAGVLGRIRLQSSALSPSLKRVADHVSHDADAVMHQTITELALQVGVGEATITRLCRKLGFAGFHAFKIALATDVLGRPPPQPSGPGIAQTHAQTLVRQCAQTLEDTAHLYDPVVMDTVAEALARAPRVDLTGQGNSGLLAQYFAHRLMRLGITAVVHTDPHLAAVSISAMPRGGVVIGLSGSGSTIDTVQHLKLAQSHGHFTVSITHRASSPVTRYASAVLFASTQEDPLTGSVLGTLTSQALVLEMLYAAVLARRPESHAMLRVTAESVVDKKY
ncbi:MurR/RpiR family transcriptional regulator [Deinococcus oregonensis]|uniref:MurR/RpiR family transcriptional regulator n=1 Tax=Deinococcus oregonensis TaxID=1805970 RepID=A0ABV6AU55_9DEIO